jgi:hypothetical protein
MSPDDAEKARRERLAEISAAPGSREELEDKRLNDQAVREGSRLLSSYRLKTG